MESLFGSPTSQLSEVFWEALKECLMAIVDLIMDGVNATFWGPRFGNYVSAVKDNIKALDNVVGFIDATVICTARPVGN